ncbi:unannotated protein [freshwater metagenome]|uniref:Unannotated protein n=1 Tax=freshwater metagenome TaxID=449393 RepID=A0A6J7XWQ6_9ZZZZ|nr:Flp family type IVb pilin [Actinomycetota bacterium]
MTKLYVQAITFGSAVFSQLQKKFENFSANDSGATAVEYSLIVGLIAVAIITAVSLLGTNISNLFNHAACVVRSGTWTAATNTCTP